MTHEKSNWALWIRKENVSSLTWIWELADFVKDDTIFFLKGVSSKVLLYSTGTSAQCYMASWMGGEFGENT